MGDRVDVDWLSYRINATNPSQLEILLASTEPGAPESLDDAAERIDRGEPVVRPEDRGAPEARP